MSDIYAEFGVNNAVIAGSSPEEHEQAMLAKDVAVRDGDDAITLGEPEEEAEAQEESQEEEITEDQPNVEEEAGSEEPQEGDFEAVGDTPKELLEASEELGNNEQGFREMVEQATERGLSTDSIARMEQEYEEKGLSEKSYEELAAAGYSRSFVDSYLRGQEALVNQYVQGIIAYAGGQEKFSAIINHLNSKDPSSAAALEEAMQTRNLPLVKTLINLAAASRGKTFGSPAARSVTKRATQAAPARTATNTGFASRAEMVKAMSDKRYNSDPAYRAEVERKVVNSTF